MSSISIIGTGNMARTIGARAIAGGNTVEVMGRDRSKAADLAKALGAGATTGEWGAGAESLGQVSGLGSIATHDLDGVAARYRPRADGTGHVPGADDADVAHEMSCPGCALFGLDGGGAAIG